MEDVGAGSNFYYTVSILYSSFAMPLPHSFDKLFSTKNSYLEEKLSAFFHDLLDLKEAGSVHEEKLVSHCHAEATCVAESQNLLEALRLHSRWELDYGGAHLVAITP